MLGIYCFDRDGYALLLVAAVVDFLLVVNQHPHLADHARVLGVKGEDDSVDAEHEADTEEDDKVGFGLSEEHEGRALHVVGEIVVRDPHVGEVEPERQHQDADQQDHGPKLGVRRQLEGDQHHHRGESE